MISISMYIIQLLVGQKVYFIFLIRCHLSYSVLTKFIENVAEGTLYFCLARKLI